jgi:hypothetical protein
MPPPAPAPPRGVVPGRAVVLQRGRIQGGWQARHKVNNDAPSVFFHLAAARSHAVPLPLPSLRLPTSTSHPLRPILLAPPGPPPAPPPQLAKPAPYTPGLRLPGLHCVSKQTRGEQGLPRGSHVHSPHVSDPSKHTHRGDHTTPMQHAVHSQGPRQRDQIKQSNQQPRGDDPGDGRQRPRGGVPANTTAPATAPGTKDGDKDRGTGRGTGAALHCV